MQEETGKRMIEKGQIKKIHTLKNVLQMTDEQYRKVIYANFCPAKSSKDLNYWQAEFLINNLEAIAKEKGVWEDHGGKSAYEYLGHREAMATPAQLRRIEAMWRDVSKIRGMKKRKKALRAWLDGYFKISDMRFVDSATAAKIMCALKEMKERTLSKDIREGPELISHDRAMGEPF